jgi:hypothetical protein
MHLRPIVAIFWCALCAAAQDTAGVNGIVVNAQTGDPLPGVQVHFGVRSSAGLGSTYGALSNKDGRFSIEGMRPGVYIPLAKHNGFVVIFRGQATVSLTAGRYLDDLRIEMTPRAVISGRVTDESGDPVEKATVRAEAVSGDPMLLTFNGGGYAVTDDHGRYRMGMPPGKYRIKAATDTFPSEEAQEVRTDGTTPGARPDAWYDIVVDCVSGRENTGVDIRMGRPVVLSLSGAVTGGGPAKINVNAHVHNGNTIYDLPAHPDGTFTIPKLEPGAYYIYAFTAGEPKMRSAVYGFVLTDTAVAGIALALRPKFEITGTLEMDNGAGTSAGRAVRLGMMTGVYGDSRTGTTDREGAFEVRGVDPERYKVEVRPLPENGYVKTVWLDRAVMPRGVLDLRNGGAGSKLKILVATDSAQISGKVEHSWGVERVFLLAEGDENGEEPVTAQVVGDGSYTLRDIAPGRYFLFALGPGGRAWDKDFVRRVAVVAEKLDVQPNGRMVRDLKLFEETANAAK